MRPAPAKQLLETLCTKDQNWFTEEECFPWPFGCSNGRPMVGGADVRRAVYERRHCIALGMREIVRCNLGNALCVNPRHLDVTDKRKPPRTIDEAERRERDRLRRLMKATRREVERMERALAREKMERNCARAREANERALSEAALVAARAMVKNVRD